MSVSVRNSYISASALPSLLHFKPFTADVMTSSQQLESEAIKRGRQMEEEVLRQLAKESQEKSDLLERAYQWAKGNAKDCKESQLMLDHYYDHIRFESQEFPIRSTLQWPKDVPRHQRDEMQVMFILDDTKKHSQNPETDEPLIYDEKTGQIVANGPSGTKFLFTQSDSAIAEAEAKLRAKIHQPPKMLSQSHADLKTVDVTSLGKDSSKDFPLTAAFVDFNSKTGQAKSTPCEVKDAAAGFFLANPGAQCAYLQMATDGPVFTSKSTGSSGEICFLRSDPDLIIAMDMIRAGLHRNCDVDTAKIDTPLFDEVLDKQHSLWSRVIDLNQCLKKNKTEDSARRAIINSFAGFSEKGHDENNLVVTARNWNMLRVTGNILT